MKKIILNTFSVTLSLFSYGLYSNLVNGLNFFTAYTLFDVQAFALTAIIAITAFICLVSQRKKQGFTNKALLFFSLAFLGLAIYVFVAGSVVYKLNALITALVFSAIVAAIYYSLYLAAQEPTADKKSGKFLSLFLAVMVSGYLVQYCMAYTLLLWLVTALALIVLTSIICFSLDSKKINKNQKANDEGLKSNLESKLESRVADLESKLKNIFGDLEKRKKETEDRLGQSGQKMLPMNSSNILANNEKVAAASRDEFIKALETMGENDQAYDELLKELSEFDEGGFAFDSA